MAEKSVGQILAGLFVGAATAATGATQGADIKDYVRTTQAEDKGRGEEVSRSIDSANQSSSGQSGQTR